MAVNPTPRSKKRRYIGAEPHLHGRTATVRLMRGLRGMVLAQFDFPPDRTPSDGKDDMLECFAWTAYWSRDFEELP